MSTQSEISKCFEGGHSWVARRKLLVVVPVVLSSSDALVTTITVILTPSCYGGSRLSLREISQL